MKGFGRIRFTFLLGFMLVCAGSLHAQSAVAPASQLGIGIFAGGALTGGGATVQYAITPAIHVGLQAGLASQSSETTAGPVTTSQTESIVSVGPYVRLLLESVVNPFFQIGFDFAENSTTNKTTNGSVSNEETTSIKGSELYVSFGLEGFISRNFGVHAAVDLLNVPTESGNATVFGIFGGKIGVDWFFAP